MDEHLIQIDNRVTAVENDIKLLKDEIAHVRNMGETSTNSNCVDDMLEEIEERKERACNVLLFKIPESLASTSNDKINDDLKVIEDILTPLGTFPKPKKKSLGWEFLRLIIIVLSKLYMKTKMMREKY
ncbi:hypothetical protein Zmor_024650 [Zophobas morio]|uniref:Uncharacterized protein n=1 Tax=Zophobas morio TaxID=2755281 RepID=A0AA38HYV0_9CUCU|nr:hypothetical protein Zmor_024650 [Zophobas morio]